jgi:hypothetical protein
MAGADLTAQRLRDLLDYEPNTGIFTRRVWRGGTSRAGSVAGASHGKTGYLQISVDGRLYFAHRLAWLHYYGEHPKKHIDHINGDKSDNRISNLRDVSRSVNLQNVRRARVDNLATGLLGVIRSRDKFSAHIFVDGKSKHLGVYSTAPEAHAAYLIAKRAMHEGCTI